MLSLIIPVYNNSENILALVSALEGLNRALYGDFEAVLVVDGSPDDSYLLLHRQLPKAGFRSQLLQLSRNFGSFAAIRAGLAAARGEYLCVMAADLQEPPELIVQFHQKLASENYDVVVGQRIGRGDPWSTRFFSGVFWGFYRRFVLPDVPEGGVDIFGCTRAVRDRIIELKENNSSLVGLLFWLGFRRSVVPYERQRRAAGKSGWTFQKKLRYLNDSVYSFSDLPIRLLFSVGALGLVWSGIFGLIILVWKLAGKVPVPGYAATVLLVSFFGALNCFGLGVIGGYVWRAFESTKFRPSHVVASHKTFDRISASSAATLLERLP